MTGRYLPPVSMPTGSTACITIRVPNDPEWLALLGGAFASLIFENSWETVPGAVSPRDAAEVFKRVNLSRQLSSRTCMIGAVVPFASTLPDNCLLCDGATYSRADYPDLYSVIDPAFVNAIAQTFTVPNLVGRVITGADPSALPGQPASHGSSGGADSVTLTVGQMPSHSHTTQPHEHPDLTHSHYMINSPGIALSVVGPGELVALAPNLLPEQTLPSGANLGPTVVVVDAAGGGQAVPTVPSHIRLRYGIIAR